MKWSLNLGRVFGIKILMHWTFLILIGWVIYTEIRKGSDTSTIILMVVFVLSVFLCVVLHELGHALTAKKFGIDTRKITLLPIGGVASLERMPEEPKKELLIAVAGPAVNVAIALILLLFVPLQEFVTDEEAMQQITAQNFFVWLLMVNIILVVFNAIPAFPMDGGRVLRAILAMKMERPKATKVAANLGQFVAILFALGGIFIGNPFLVLIGIFVFFGAYSENMMVQHLEFLRGYLVKDAMMTDIPRLHPWEPIKTAVDLLISGTDQDFIVEEDGKVLGIISRSILINAIKENGMEIRANQVMDKEFETIDVNEKLPLVFSKLQKKKNSFLPVTENGILAGAINMENLSEFVMVRSALN